MSGEVNVVALARGEEQYVFVFDEARRTELLRMLGRYAADPSLSFNWYDAAVVSQRVREMMPAGVAETISQVESIGRACPSERDSDYPIQPDAMHPRPRFRMP